MQFQWFCCNLHVHNFIMCHFGIGLYYMAFIFMVWLHCVCVEKWRFCVLWIIHAWAIWFAGYFWHILYLKSLLAIMNGTCTVHISFLLTMLSLPLAGENISAQYARYPPNRKHWPKAPLFTGVGRIVGGAILFLRQQKWAACAYVLVVTNPPLTPWVGAWLLRCLKYPYCEEIVLPAY